MRYFTFPIIILTTFWVSAAAPPPNVGTGTGPVTKGAPPTLPQALVLREEQETAGGRTVKTWTITPDGTLTVVRNSLDLKGQPNPGWPRTVRSATLTPVQIRALAMEVEAQRPQSLPGKIGADLGVNAHSYTLRVGKKESILYGVPPLRGGSVKDHLTTWAPECEDKSAVDRFATVAQRIVESGGTK